MSEAVDRVKDLMEWWKNTRPARALAWYGARRGNLLCGGIAYTALFSLAAGLTIGFSVFSATLGNRTELQAAVFEQINTWIPGLIATGGHRGALTPDQLILPHALNPASIVAVVVLLFSALGFMNAIRISVRTMFGLPATSESAVWSKVWALVGFALLGMMVLTSAAASIVSQRVGGEVRDALGSSALVGWSLSLGSIAAGVVLDAFLVFLLIRVVARVRPPSRRDLLLGCLVAGLVAGFLRWAGTSIVLGSASRNALLASFAVIVTVLVLVNFVARVLLMVCALIHDPPRLDELELAEAQVAARREAVEIDRVVRRGHGSGRPWSPVVRGVRRGSYGVGPSVRTRG